MDKVLYGKSQLQNVVGVRSIDLWGEDTKMRVYRREGDHVDYIDKSFRPFFYVSDMNVLSGFTGDYTWGKRKGNLKYNYIVIFNSFGVYNNARKYIKAKTEEYRPNQLLQIYSNAQMFYTHTGITEYLGMGMDDPYKLSVDIEVYSEGEAFPNSQKKSDEVFLIAFADNRGWEHVIHSNPNYEGGFHNERQLLFEFTDIIDEKDPDQIIGHNIFDFDLSYLRDRCDMLDVPFDIGRDRTETHSYQKDRRIGGREYSMEYFRVPGRSVYDTMFACMDYDTFARDLPGYGLKVVAEYFGVTPSDRTMIEGSEIAQAWDEDPKRVIDYAKDDVREALGVARQLVGSTFYTTQILPMSFQEVHMRGNTSKIQALFLRAYTQEKYSIPKSEEGYQEDGGFVKAFIQGRIDEPLNFADVGAMYPSIILNYDVKPERDELNTFQYCIQRLQEMRDKEKKKLQGMDKDSEKWKEVNSLQNSYKILCNSFYGSLSSPGNPWNDYSEGQRVAKTGQKILSDLIQKLKDDGRDPVTSDTDGIVFIAGTDNLQKQAEYCRKLTNYAPPGIELDHEGSFKRALILKKKNYVLEDYEGNTKFKGSAIISRSGELFGREFVRKGYNLLLEGDVEQLYKLYNDTVQMIRNRDWTVDDFSKTVNLNKSLEQYQKDLEENENANPLPHYEVALRDAKENGANYTKGSRVSFYVSGHKKPYKVTVYECAKLAREWDPENPDENIRYYEKKRLGTFCDRFRPFLTDHDFKKVFSEKQNLLFPIQLGEVEIQTRKIHE